MSEPQDFTKAVPIGGIEAEYEHLHKTACPCGGVFAGRGQTLLRDPAGKPYDLIDGACVKCGAARTFLFDIGAFFGKRGEAAPPVKKSEIGCFVLIWLLSAGAAVGGIFAWTHGNTGLTFVAFLAAFILACLGRTARTPAPAPPAPTPAGPPALEGAAETFAILAYLGIPPDLGEQTPQNALTGGMAKAILARGFKALAERRWADAETALTAAIQVVEKNPALSFHKLLSVAHRLRGEAREGADRKAEALADYDRALALLPGDADAEAGKKRLSS